SRTGSDRRGDSRGRCYRHDFGALTLFQHSRFCFFGSGGLLDISLRSNWVGQTALKDYVVVRAALMRSYNACILRRTLGAICWRCDLIFVCSRLRDDPVLTTRLRPKSSARRAHAGPRRYNRYLIAAGVERFSRGWRFLSYRWDLGNRSNPLHLGDKIPCALEKNECPDLQPLRRNASVRGR